MTRTTRDLITDMLVTARDRARVIDRVNYETDIPPDANAERAGNEERVANPDHMFRENQRERLGELERAVTEWDSIAAGLVTETVEDLAAAGAD